MPGPCFRDRAVLQEFNNMIAAMTMSPAIDPSSKLKLIQYLEHAQDKHEQSVRHQEEQHALDMALRRAHYEQDQKRKEEVHQIVNLKGRNGPNDGRSSTDGLHGQGRTEDRLEKDQGMGMPKYSSSNLEDSRKYQSWW